MKEYIVKDDYYDKYAITAETAERALEIRRSMEDPTGGYTAVVDVRDTEADEEGSKPIV